MTMPKGIKIVDTWINLNPPKGWMQMGTRPLLRDSESLDASHPHTQYLFKDQGDRSEEGATPEQIIALMDHYGIDKAVLNVKSADPDFALKVIETYPDRLVGALTVNPHDGMAAVRKLEKIVKEHPLVKATKISAHTIQKPYNDKIYYPIYAKCIELDIPITANVGIPGPRVPGEAQNPLYLDEVCWFFPELKVIMTHGGEPWQFMCVKLMLKWSNLYYMTSAFVPSHYPPEIVRFMNTRGADKVMFATDYPVLGFERCFSEVKDLPLRDNVWSKFLRDNAVKVFKL